MIDETNRRLPFYIYMMVVVCVVAQQMILGRSCPGSWIWVYQPLLLLNL